MNPKSRDYPMHRAATCGAKTRCGMPCRSPAMINGRCRMHGGRSLAGEESPRFKHGRYTREAIAERREIRALIARSWETLSRIETESYP
jgi:hypothetical protein